MIIDNFSMGVITGLIPSFLVSYGFWYFTVCRPRKKGESNILEYTRIIIRGIIGQGKSVFKVLLKEADIQKEFKDITREDINLLGPKVKLKKEAPPIIGFVIYKGVNFAQYLSFYKDRTTSDINRLFTYIYFLDSKLIKRLNRVFYCGYFILCDEWLKNIDLVTDPDLTAFSNDLFEYYNAIKDLENYCLEDKILKE